MVAYRIGRNTEKVDAALAAQGKQITAVTEEVKKLGEVITRQAVQDERLDRLRRDVEEIRRGRGLIDWPWPGFGVSHAS
jgi:hypothetical protein